MSTGSYAIGHRGWPERFPDNCLAGFTAASAVAPAVELDVRRSLDGKLALSHDPTTAGLVVADTPWPVLAEVDLGDGHRPALLDEVISALPDAAIQIEIKNHPDEAGYEPDHRLALEAAERARPRDLVTSYNPATVDAVRSMFPGVRTGLVVTPAITLEEAVRRCVDGGHAALIPREDMISGPLPLSEGLEFHPFTVNCPDRARELAEGGASGIITDDPGLMSERLGARR